MKPPKCRVCGSEHWGGGHVFATNKATNRIATNDVATNKRRELRGGDTGRVDRPEPVVGFVSPEGGEGGKTANRRARGVYNAYQRLYMATKRAIARGDAMPWKPA
jgi:hypothetical protein